MSQCSPDTQVLGAVVLSILATSHIDELQPLFDKYGVSSCKPNEFYPTDVFKQMIDEIVGFRQGLDSMYDFVSLGISNGLNVPLTPDIDSLEKWLTIFETRYTTLYKGSDIGYVKCNKIAEGHYQLNLRWPWVDDVAYGMIYGMCMRFLPVEQHFQVYYNDPPVRCDFGDNETIIHVTW